MEKTDVPLENKEQILEESKKVIDQVTDDVSKKIEETNGKVQTKENKIEEVNVEKNDDEVGPSTTPKPIEEEKNVTDSNTTVSASVSSDRSNVSFKEENESEKDACITIVNGTENINNNKRELDNEDEQIQEKILDNDEQTSDQTKKIKITELTDATTAVEV